MPTYRQFAVTITLNPKLCEYMTHVEQYNLVIPYVMNEIPKYPSSIDNVHLSIELTASHNIHLHLAVTTGFAMKLSVFKDLITIVFASSLFGYHKCVPIYNEIGWLSYISKGEYFQEKYLYAF